MSYEDPRFIENMPAGQRLLKALSQLEEAGVTAPAEGNHTSESDFPNKKEVQNKLDDLIQRVEEALV